MSNASKSLLIIAMFTISSLSFANCSNVIRFHILKKLKLDSHVRLFKRADKKHFKIKRKELQSTLMTFGSRRKQLALNRTEAFRVLKEFFKTKLVDRKFKKALKVFSFSIYDPKLISEWSEGLHKELVLETYIEGDTRQIENVNQNLSIPEQMVVDVLMHRSIEGGFGSNVEIYKELIYKRHLNRDFKKQKEFSYFKRLNVDDVNLIRMLQIDFLIFAMKKSKIDPVKVSEILIWIENTDSSIYLKRSNDYFIPSSNVWATNFDGYEKGLNNPDILNQILIEHFKIY